MKKLFNAIAVLSIVSAAAQAQTYSCEPVDMGLSVQWASSNIGASDAVSPGDYFAWGTVANANNTPEVSTASNYGMKLTTNPITGLLPDENDPTSPYDIASHLLGNGWHTPTKAEWNELYDNCTASSVTLEDGTTKVLRLTSKINGNHIDLCPTGYYNGATLATSGYICLQMSDNVSNDTHRYVRTLPNSSDLSTAIRNVYNLMPVRAVYRDPDENIPVESITVAPEHTVPAGSVIKISATVMPLNASNTGLEWSSSDETVAIVDKNGSVTGVKEGECTITIAATDGSGVSAECTVTVCRSLTGSDFVDMGTSAMWSSKNLGAADVFSAGNYYRFGEIEAMSTADYQFAEKTSLEGVQIKGNPSYDAATAALGADYSTPSKKECEDLIANCDIKSIHLDGEDGLLYISKTTGNTLFFPSSGYKDSKNPAIIYDNDIAYVRTSDYNAESAFSIPECYVIRNKAIWKKDADYCIPVRAVYQKEITEIILSTTQLTLERGEEHTVVATVSPEDATEKRLEWKSSDEAVATVDADGKITAVNAGNCVVTVSATDNSGVTAQIEVTVSLPQYVDMGLSVMWGAANLDAATEYETGGYYRLGDLTSRSSVRNPFYHYSVVEGKTVTGNPEYDAATAKMGDNWCTPTREMFQELIDNCEITQDWSDEHNNGYVRFTSKINGNSIVIPYSGYYSSAISPFPSETDAVYSLTSTFVPYTNINDPVKIYNLKNESLRENYLSGFYCTIRPVYKMQEVVEAESLEFDKAHYDIKVGEEIDITYTLLPENVTNKKLTWVCSEQKCCTVDENGHVTALAVGTCEVTAITSNGLQASCTVTVTTDSKVAYVDMGTSVMWAESNLGATKPSEKGDYYCLGNIIKESTTNSWNLFGPNLAEGLKLVNDPRYDAATANLGLAWHIPTAEEMQELIDNCTVSTYVLDGVVGKLFTSKTTGNTLFFPQSGRKPSPKTIMNEGAVMSMTSSWDGQLNLILFDDALTSQSDDDKPLYRTQYFYTVRPVRSTAVEAEKIEIAATLKEGISYQAYDLEATVYPENASCRNVAWTTSDPDAISVKELNPTTLRNAMAAVYFNAEGNGPWEVIANAVDGSGITAVYIINRTPASVEIVEIDINMEYDVYDLLGRRVIAGALYTDMRQQLKPGLYILAGDDGSRIKIKI